MIRSLSACLILGVMSFACSRHETLGLSSDPKIAQIQKSIADGNYDEAVSETKEMGVQVPLSPLTQQALYLEAYCMVYGWGDFHQATRVLHQLLDEDPKGSLGLSAERLLADSDYWQGNYLRATREYGKLLSQSDQEVQDYSNLQIANCLLLKNKVGDAITAYRAIVDKDSPRRSAEMAQMMIANIYLKIQNPVQAKTEFQKLMSFTKNKAFQEDAQTNLREIDAQEPFKKPTGGTE